MTRRFIWGLAHLVASMGLMALGFVLLPLTTNLASNLFEQGKGNFFLGAFPLATLLLALAAAVYVGYRGVKTLKAATITAVQFCFLGLMSMTVLIVTQITSTNISSRIIEVLFLVFASAALGGMIILFIFFTALKKYKPEVYAKFGKTGVNDGKGTG